MKATFFDTDGRVYMAIEGEAFDEIDGFLRGNGWTKEPVSAKDFPLIVQDGAGTEFTVRLEE